VTVSADMTADLWRKLAFIATMGVACGLSRSPIGAIRKTSLGALLIERAVHEAFAVARARGVRLAPDEDAKTLQFIASLGDGIKPSLLVDLEAGNRTEVEDLSGAISRLGRLSGVETPIHDTATAAIGTAR
jgi:2-dehydropantoate 2-reductase